MRLKTTLKRSDTAYNPSEQILHRMIDDMIPTLFPNTTPGNKQVLETEGKMPRKGDDCGIATTPDNQINLN